MPDMILTFKTGSAGAGQNVPRFELPRLLDQDAVGERD